MIKNNYFFLRFTGALNWNSSRSLILRQPEEKGAEENNMQNKVHEKHLRNNILHKVFTVFSMHQDTGSHIQQEGASADSAWRTLYLMLNT